MENYELEDLKIAIEEKDVRGVESILKANPDMDVDKETLSLAIESGVQRIATAVTKRADNELFDKDIINKALQTRNFGIVDAVVKKTPKNEIDKEVLKQAISTNLPQIMSSVARKTDSKNFDKEILDTVFNTKDTRMIKPLLTFVDDKLITKEKFMQSTELKDNSLIDMVAKKMGPEHFDKEVLDKAFETKYSRVVATVVEKSPAEFFDKDMLNRALETRNSQILHAVANKTDSKHFDKNFLESAIKTKQEDIVRVAVQKINPEFINKEIVKLAVDSKVPKIVYAVGKYSKATCFDKEILERALEGKNGDVVRAVLDYTTDRKIFSEYRNQIQKAILKAPDIRNLTAQILSRRDNASFDREMQELVVDIYMDVIKEHFKADKMPKNFPMKDFEESMNESRYFFSNPAAVNFDSLDKKNRFLMVPVFSYGHAFSAVVRKLEDDKISITFVNLGARPFERDRAGNQYKEFVYNKKDALKVLNDHSYSVRLYYPEKAVDTNKAYKNFAKNAVESYILNVTSRDQKVGNCFTKNIEKGIRYALALGLSKTEDKTFDPNSLRVSVAGEGKLRVKFLKPIHRKGEMPNELDTVELRKALIGKILQRFPEYEKDIMAEWKIYEARKEKTRPEPTQTPVVFDKNRVAARKIAGMNDINHKAPRLDMVAKDINQTFVAKMNAFVNRDLNGMKNAKELRAI